MASIEERLRKLAEEMFEAGSPEAETAGMDAREAADLIAEMRAALEAMRAAAVNGNRGLSDALVLADEALDRAKGE